MKKFVLILSLFLFLGTSAWCQEKSLAERASDEAQKIHNNCIQMYEEGQETTAEIVIRNIKINNCIADAIKSEIKIGFSQKQQNKMFEKLELIRESVLAFYQTLHSENIYCDNSCGSISTLLPYADEGYALHNMLENLIYLNLQKGGRKNS